MWDAFHKRTNCAVRGGNGLFLKKTVIILIRMRDALDLKEFKPNRKVPNYAQNHLHKKTMVGYQLPVKYRSTDRPLIFIHVPINNTKY